MRGGGRGSCRRDRRERQERGRQDGEKECERDKGGSERGREGKIESGV